MTSKVVPFLHLYPRSLPLVFNNLVGYQFDSYQIHSAHPVLPLLSNVNGHVKKAAKMLPFF
ncbi:hypothetical protein [Leclercia sp. AS011]|uniref:hypothetical protein n=1 Tax=Leclercia sp. AS011 TaxID=3081257 RepID=UPI0030199D4B